MYCTLWPCQVSNLRSPAFPGPKVAPTGAPPTARVKEVAVLEGPPLTAGLDCGAAPVDVGGAEGLPRIPVEADASGFSNAGADAGTC